MEIDLKNIDTFDFTKKLKMQEEQKLQYFMKVKI